MGGLVAAIRASESGWLEDWGNGGAEVWLSLSALFWSISRVSLRLMSGGRRGALVINWVAWMERGAWCLGTASISGSSSVL